MLGPAITMYIDIEEGYMSLPTVGITDHELRDYSHNIVVQYVDNQMTHTLEFCTYVPEPHDPDHNDIRQRLYKTLELLGPDTNDYVLRGVTWTDDI